MKAVETISQCEQLALDVFNRDIVFDFYGGESFFVRFIIALQNIQRFFWDENPSKRKKLLIELSDLIVRFEDLSLGCVELLDYLKETAEYINGLAAEDVDRHSWKGERLSDEAQSLPSMLCLETRQYYKWLGSQLRGDGEIVELGSWLGSSTYALAEGKAGNILLTDRQIYSFDSFIWGTWMEKYAGGRMQCFPRRGESYIDLFINLCSKYEHFINPIRFYLYAEGESGVLPPLEWNSKPIELFIFDIGHEYFLINEAWHVFAPFFLDGRTIVVFSPYGNARAEGLRRFCKERSYQLLPIHKPESAAKAYLFTGKGKSFAKASS